MAQYPREIYLDPETELRLTSYLEEELTNHDAERGKFLDDVINWQKDYWAQPPSEVGTFPFQGSSTIIVPLTAITFETIHARTMQQLYGGKQFISAKGTNSMWAPHAQKIESFLDDELLNRIKVRRQTESPIMECELFGVGVMKSGYEKIIKTAVRPGVEEGTDEEFDVVIKEGACIDGTPVSKFLMPFYCLDPQTADWCGEIHSETPINFKAREASGLFRQGSWSKIENWVIGSQNPQGTNSERRVDREQEYNENRVAVFPKTLDYYELWLSFDVDKTGKPKEIVVLYHRDSRTFLSIRYNWHHDLRRPYRCGNYMPIAYRWMGVGIAKQNELFQKELTAIHRQLLDNGTLANARMIAISKLSDYGPNEPVFPGKMWFLDDPSKDIKEVQLGEVYSSSYGNENQTLMFAQMRTGANELTAGMPSSGTPGTATDTITRVQEGNKRFDYAYANINAWIKDVVMDTISCIQQYGPRNLSVIQNADGGDAVQAYLKLPPDQVRDQIFLTVSVASQKDNNALDRQNWVQVWQASQQYYQMMIQAAMQFGDIQRAALYYMKSQEAAAEIMQQFFQSFDIRSIERIIPIREILQMSQMVPPSFQQMAMQQQMGMMNGNPSGNPQGANGASQAPGVGGSTQVAPRGGSGGQK